MIYPSLLLEALRDIGYGAAEDCPKVDDIGAPRKKLTSNEWSRLCRLIEDRHHAVTQSAHLGDGDAYTARGMYIAAEIADRISRECQDRGLFAGGANDASIAADVAAAIRRSASEIEREDRGALARKAEEKSAGASEKGAVA